MASTSNRIAGGLSIALVLFLIGVVYAGLTLPQRPKPTDYNLSIEASMQGDEVQAHGKTNLPDGARLSVVVDRLYRLQGSGTWHSARTGETSVDVHQGQWRATVPIDDSKWVKEVAEKVNTNEIDPVEAVQSKLRATVVFSPLVPQVGFVWETMGAGFEGLSKSESAMQAGGQWMIRRDALIDHPLAQNLEEQLLP